MTNDKIISEEASFPETGLDLLNFAQRECRAACEAWQAAKKEVAVAGGRGSMASQFAGYRGPIEPRAPSRLIDVADACAVALQDAVLDRIKNGHFIVQGVPEKEYLAHDIPVGLLDAVRLINWSRSLIVCAGARRFEFVLIAPSQQIVAQAPQVVSNVIAVRPSARSGMPGAVRGRRPERRVIVKNAMLAELRDGRSATSLAEMKEEEMAAKYKASRDTCRKARRDALVKLNSRQIATVDK